MVLRVHINPILGNVFMICTTHNFDHMYILVIIIINESKKLQKQNF